MGSLWGDRPEDEARKCLRTALWRMRSVVEPDDIEPGTYILIRADELGFNWESDYWLDLEQLERALRDARAQVPGHIEADTVRSLSSAVDLYDGPLLDGVYEEWALTESERVRAMFLRAVEDLVTLHMHRAEWEAALRRGRQLLQHDPLREHVHRDLMRCHYAMGNRPGALKQYAACAEALREELDIEPMQETRDLHRAVLSGDAEVATPRDGPPPESVDGPVAGLEQAARELEEVAVRIREGLRALGANRASGRSPRTPA